MKVAIFGNKKWKNINKLWGVCVGTYIMKLTLCLSNLLYVVIKKCQKSIFLISTFLYRGWLFIRQLTYSNLIKLLTTTATVVYNIDIWSTFWDKFKFARLDLDFISDLIQFEIDRFFKFKSSEVANVASNQVTEKRIRSSYYEDSSLSLNHTYHRRWYWTW